MNRNPVNCYWQHQTDHHLQNPITCASSKTHPCHANSSKVLLELHGSTKPTTTCRIRSPHASHETHLCHTISSKLLLELHASTKQTTICRIQSPVHLRHNFVTPISSKLLLELHVTSSKLLLELHASTKQTTTCRIQSPPSSNLDTPLSDHFKQTPSLELQVHGRSRSNH